MNHEWSPSGVPGSPVQANELTDDQWKTVTDLWLEKTGSSPTPILRSDLDEALNAYEGMKQIQQNSSPGKIRENVRDALNTALDLNSRLNELDGSSRKLLGDMRILHKHLDEIILPLSRAAEIAAQYPKSGSLRDFPALNLGVFVAKAMTAQGAGDRIKATKGGLFESLLLVMLIAAGQDREEVHGLARRILRFREDHD